jgi:ankyrin repeat protein
LLALPSLTTLAEETASESLYWALDGPVPPSARYVRALLLNGADPNIVDEYGDSPMTLAPAWSHELGSSEVLQLLLEAGGDAGHRNEEAESPLHVATAVSDVSMLVEGGADPNARSIFGWTPLFYVAGPGTAEALLAAGAEVDARDEFGYTALHFAGTAPIAKVLITAGADVQARSELGETPLFEAVQLCPEEGEEALFEALHAAGGSLEVRNTDSETLLHAAAANADCENSLQWLIENQFDDVNPVDGIGRTPLSHAAERNQSLTVLDHLLQAGANPATRCQKGRLPLHWGARGNANPAVVSRLLGLQGDPDVVDQNGVTPLMIAAARNENPRVVRMLLDAGADVNATMSSGLKATPVTLALRFNPAARDIVPKLIAAGADLSILDSNGLTPLMWAAARTDDVESLRYLLTAGVDVDARGASGRTALMQAAAFSTIPDAVALLLNAGADATLQDEEGARAIDLAHANEHLAGDEVLWRLNDLSY